MINSEINLMKSSIYKYSKEVNKISTPYAVCVGLGVAYIVGMITIIVEVLA